MASCAGSCAGLAVGEGCESGACVSVFSGEPEGAGVIPGVGICMSCCPDGTWGTPVGAGDAVGDGITMPGVCLWPAGIGVPVDLAFGFCADAFRLTFRFDFRLGVVFGFGFGLLIPGIWWPSCWANRLWVEESENDRINAADRNRCLYDFNEFFTIPYLEVVA